MRGIHAIGVCVACIESASGTLNEFWLINDKANKRLINLLSFSGFCSLCLLDKSQW